MTPESLIDDSYIPESVRRHLPGPAPSPCFDPGLGPAPARPTPDFIDELARRYQTAKLDSIQAQQIAKLIEDEAVALVEQWGSVPPHAEKSRRLNGRLAELTITKSDAIAVSFERVEVLREALEADGRGEYFKKLFAKTEKYEIVDGAENALREEALPKRLAEKVLNLFGRCITVKPKKPSLKVTIADPAKPAKRVKKAKA
jgi:hypothetical protein